MNSLRFSPAFAVVCIACAVVAARVIWLTTAAAPPLHFDEAQYWSYGESLAGGYYSKPPLLPWMIRLSTEIFGDTAFGVRAFAPVYHGAVALLIYGIAARMFAPGAFSGKVETGFPSENATTQKNDAQRIGFWAAILYLLLPGVSASSVIASTDPPMMVCWAGALYAVIRAAEPKASLGWAALAGGLIGAGLLGKYTMAALPGSLLGYALFARQGPVRWGGVGLAIVAGLVAAAPNLMWNAQNAFAAVAHVGENANLGGRLFNPGKMLEFIGAQAAIFTPVLAAALVWMLVRPSAWRMDPRFRLLLWTCVPLLTIMTIQAFLSRAHPNWAAPAYISGTIVVSAWLVRRGRAGWIKAAAAFGLVAWAGLWGVAQVYAGDNTALPRLYDPFKKTRLYPALCARISPHMQAENAALILSDDRRLLANCLFSENLGMEAIATYNPSGGTSNHYELVASLRPGEDRPMIVVALSDAGFGATPDQDGWRLLEQGDIRTHAGDGKAVRPYWIWAADTFSDYPSSGEERP